MFEADVMVINQLLRDHAVSMVRPMYLMRSCSTATAVRVKAKSLQDGRSFSFPVDECAMLHRYMDEASLQASALLAVSARHGATAFKLRLQLLGRIWQNML